MDERSSGESLYRNQALTVSVSQSARFFYVADEFLDCGHNKATEIVLVL
jgi:hypothetical protein